MRNDYIKGLEKELDSLSSDKTIFKYIGKDRIKVLLDKDVDKPTTGLKLRFSKTGRYVTVFQRLYSKGTCVETSLGRNLLSLGKDETHLVCDHINRNPLDNRLCNLRVASKSQNSINRLDENKSCSYKHLYLNEYGDIFMDFTFRSKRKGGRRFKMKFNRYERIEPIAVLADCINILYGGEFAVTNFDRTIYTPEFIDFYLDVYKVDKDNLMSIINEANSFQ